MLLCPLFCWWLSLGQGFMWCQEASPLCHGGLGSAAPCSLLLQCFCHFPARGS